METDNSQPQPDTCIVCGQPLEDGRGLGWCADCNPREEIARLRRHLVELEAALASAVGSMELHPGTSEPTQFEWNVPANAPGNGNERS